ncbi:hypothetical protein ACIA6D_35270 [Streptomyces cacaoi]
MRTNRRRATGTIRDKRLAATAELDGWEEPRECAAAAERRPLRYLDPYLKRLEKAVAAAGDTVHRAGHHPGRPHRVPWAEELQQ